MSADLSHIDTWLFDLDNTLYPAECGFMGHMERRMTEVVQRITELPRAEAFILQKKLLAEHGTTLAGLMVTHKVDPMGFINEVHDELPIECIPEAPELRSALESLPGRRLIFTNADEKHASRVLNRLGIADLFDDMFHIEHSAFVPKPNAGTFARMIEHHVLVSEMTCFFEDSARNLEPAAKLGMTTVLVGPHALENRDAFVHHRTPDLAAFLAAAKTSAT